MDERKDLQGLGDGQNSIYLVIITLFLLHIFMLETIQLICCIGLSLHHVCIPKVLQLLAIGTPDKFIASFFCNILTKILSYWLHSILTIKLAPNWPSHQLRLCPIIYLSILCMWKEPSLQSFHHLWVCVFCVALYWQGGQWWSLEWQLLALLLL